MACVRSFGRCYPIGLKISASLSQGLHLVNSGRGTLGVMHHKRSSKMRPYRPKQAAVPRVAGGT